MATTINEIIKEALERVKAEHLNLTPDNYAAVFCKVAKQKGVIVEDCQKVDKYTKKLESSVIADMKRFNIASLDELLSFLVARVNRVNEGDAIKMINALNLLSKRLLQAITLLHDAKATSLANASLERIDFHQNIQSIELVKDKWFDFISNYNDHYLKKLDLYGHVNKDDLEMMVRDIVKLLDKDTSGELYKALVPLIIASLVPSIASGMNDELANISAELRQSPDALGTPALQKEIRSLIGKRIELDKAEVQKKVSVLDKVLDEINKRIAELIQSSQVSHEQVKGIRADLQNINFSHDSFETVHAKLLHIASSLESETKTLHDKMLSNQETITKLQNRVNKLESALVAAKQEVKIDFLTHVATKRALSAELGRVEEAFMRYKIDYTLCFIDIDYFKRVNDTFGHEAGDVILSTVGKILRKYVRQVDFAGRYGGEEFLVVLPSTDLVHAIHFADKIRSIVEQFKFLYKNERISVTVSCGVAQRSQYTSKEETLSAADAFLYKAKEAGRNQVMPVL
ncbi:GGDEF domain-containing protein [Sulfurospirillum deleyianum]|uniref:diguanylate cyclase n=1 Tax=Sulfurospirillum deleyianum (strain ATCC 51133 / DSM 6946 / 5175) TaxID=525898 RepID=D1B3G3_SULD5|nr:GGDEF domain-containing protein [Sulfurospirillum deleyianum]ACZ12633.1 diguanylate cyclase [Sulfurospirillum deleyianum DSM 6946]